MNVLGIETSTSVCSVGFVNDRGVSLERNIVDPHIHSERLLSLIDDVRSQAGESLQTLDAIAVSIGPGSFTGLRIGLSTAKGLCYALGCRLISVPTFDAVAETVRREVQGLQHIVIVVDAKQGEFYFTSTDAEGQRGTATTIVDAQRLEHLPKNGGGLSKPRWLTDRADIIQSLGVKQELIAAYSSFCRGDFVARIGIEKLRVNDVVDLASIEPMYLKNFVVKTAIN